MKHLIIIILAFFATVSTMKAQDTEFWFVAPDIDFIYTPSPHCDTPTRLIITAQDRNSNVTISYRGGTKSISRSISAGTTEVITFARNPVAGEYDLADIENQPPSSPSLKNNYGIHITSDNPVHVNYQADGPCLRDLFTLKGKNALGKRFFLPFQNQFALQVSSYPNSRRSFHIVASENNTTVNINLKNGSLQNYGATTSFQVNLNAGETWAGVGSSYTQALYGTEITSNKDIAVTILENTFNGDMCGDQLVAVDNLGKNYVVLRTYSIPRTISGNEYAFIIATEPSTTVVATNANGANTNINLTTAGDMYALPLLNTAANEYFVLKANKPIYVYHLSGDLSSPSQESGASLLPSMYSIQNKDISFFKPANNYDVLAHYIFVITHKDNINNFLLNNAPLSGGNFLSFHSASGMGDWRYLRMNISTLPNGINNIKNTNGAFSLGYMFGSGSSGSYGYLSGFGDFHFPADTIYACEDGVTLSGGYAGSYKWEYSPAYNGPYSLLAETSSSLSTDKAGYYALEMDQDPEKVRDTVLVNYVDFNPLISPVAISPTEVSTSFSVTVNPILTSNPNLDLSYEWEFEEDDIVISTSNQLTPPVVTWNADNTDRIARLTITASANSHYSIGGCRKTFFVTTIDNISDAECYIDPPATKWSIDETWISSYKSVESCRPWYVGDLDGDGASEIVALSLDGKHTTGAYIDLFNKIVVFPGHDRDNHKIINTVEFGGYYFVSAYGIVRVNNMGLIILVGTDGFLHAYNYTTGLRQWVSTQKAIAGTEMRLESPNVGFADFNNDGKPEVYVGNRIFDAATGTYLCAGNATNRGFSLQNSTTYGGCLTVAVDIDGDGKLELIAGNHAYKVTENSGSWSMSEYRHITPPVLSNGIQVVNDGHASIADLNNDGHVDVVVSLVQNTSNTYYSVLYGWDVYNNKILFREHYLSASRSVPFIGDIDGAPDKRPEIITLFNINLRAYKLPATFGPSSGLSLFWDITVDEASGRTGITLFDFNQDDIAELVYRDQVDLRIINGSLKHHLTGAALTAPYNLNTFTSLSATTWEYPVIADVDNDEMAEIVVAGGRTEGVDARMSIYKSDIAGGAQPWAPSRKVWNQYAYNAVNVNEDLTIPKYQLNPASTFPGEDGTFGTTDDVNPYNNFLQQQTMLSKNGNPLWITPNGQIAKKPVFNYDVNADSMTITVEVYNAGDAPFQSPFYITVYHDNVGGTPKYTYIYNDVIHSGDTAVITFGIKDFKKDWYPFNNIIIQINDNGNGLNQQAVCDSTYREVITSDIIATDDRYLIFINSKQNLLDVEYNDIYPCSTPTIQLVTGAGPSHGTANIVFGKIVYEPATDYIGGDTLKYSIHCGTVSKADTATVIINVIPKTDNISDADCFIEPPAQNWNIRIAWMSAEIASVFAIPLVGDLDGDNIPEIVCFGYAGQTAMINGSPRINTILVYDGVSHVLKATITMPSYIVAYDASSYGLVRTPDNKGLIIAACVDYKIRAYDITASNPNIPVWTTAAGEDFGSGAGGYATTVSFADFNQDGYPEVYLRGKIYDAMTGKLLATASGGNNLGLSYGDWTHATGYKLSTSIAGDVTGDGKLDLIMGNEIYEINITNRTSSVGNTISRVKTITPPAGVPEDGHAQIADFNNDGYPDIFISIRDVAGNNGIVYGYVWDVYNNSVSTPFSIATNFSGKSIPLIGDIDNDGLLEVVIQCAVTGTTNRMRAYKYNPSTSDFTLMWGLYMDEDSYSNSATLFDFNQDGMNELMITDQSTIRIVNGSGKSHITGDDTTSVYVMSSFNFTEITAMQYPVIADVDLDGSAELVAVGKYNSSSQSNSGSLNIFKSETTPWAPARPVWNQYMYNSVNINDDLTTPKYQLSPATVFPGRDSLIGTVDDVRPYNNFLQQQTMLNKFGNPLWITPDVALDHSSSYTITRDNDLIINAVIRNDGDASFTSPLHYTVYQNFVSVGNMLLSDSLLIQIDTGQIRTVTITIPDISTVSPTPVYFYLRINDKNGVFPYYPECDTLNNEMEIINPLIMRKEATLLITPQFKSNGTYPNPVSVLFSEDIRYDIKAVNATLQTKDMVITDTIPAYLRYVSGSAAGSVSSPAVPYLFSVDSSNVTVGSVIQNRFIWKFTNVPSMDSVKVYLHATPESGSVASQPLYMNKAWVTIPINPGDSMYMPTNHTYHQGAGISIVTFSANFGGNIYNAEEQALDYCTSPRSGIVIIPDNGYRFTGWSHNDYVSLRGDIIDGRKDILYYDTLTVYGNVEIKANFAIEEYPVLYYLNGSRNAESNPLVYNIESGDLALEAPSKADDEFIGWTGSNGDEPQQNVIIPERSTGGLEFYANFLYSGRENDSKKSELNEDKIWAVKDEVFIRTSKAGSVVRIYSADGILKKIQTIVTAGEIKIKLTNGIYAITINNDPGQMVRIE